MSDWSDIPLSVGVGLLIVDRVIRAVRELRMNGRSDQVIDGNIGSKSVDYWKGQMATIVYTEIERHIKSQLVEANETLREIANGVNELRWRSWNGRRGDSSK